jgi:hypothetical protein
VPSLRDSLPTLGATRHSRAGLSHTVPSALTGRPAASAMFHHDFSGKAECRL